MHASIRRIHRWRAAAAPPGAAWAALVALACWGAGDTAPRSGGGSTPPNVALVILDDVGLDALELYADVGIHRADLAERVPWAWPRMPTLDALAARGVRFTQARTNPTCSSSRATLLTGRYAFRHGIGGLVRPARGRLAEAETHELGVGAGYGAFTLGHLARAGGLTPLYAGKYHLALHEEDPAGPRELAPGGARPQPGGTGWNHVREVAGFERYWVVWDNLPVRPPPEPWADGEGAVHQPGYYNFVACRDGEPEAVRGRYATEAQVDEALALVRGAQAPWLLVLSFSAPHAPFDLPPPEQVSTARYLERAGEVLKARSSRSSTGAPPSVWPFYQAKLEALDHQLGRFVDELERLDQLDSTVFLVVGDNGTPNRVVENALEREGLPLGRSTSAALRDTVERFKHSVFEPGVRVPLIIAGPGVERPGRSHDGLVDAVDLFETVRELLSVPGERLPEQARDGISLVPVLRGAGATPRPFAYVERFQPNGDPRDLEYAPGQMSNNYQWRRGLVLETEAGRFKLVRNLDEDGDPRDRLFQLAGAGGEPVDPWELDPLDPAEHAPLLSTLRDRLERLLSDGPGGDRQSK